MRMCIGANGSEYEFKPDLLGKGWETILIDLYDDLIKLGWDRHLYQYKEKFGGLRFYIGYGNEFIFDRISQAEGLSMHTCMDCGNPGTVRGGVWLMCLCDEHSNEELDTNE
jgi:hypothetical protein